jgi:aminodeoxyfutalosine synthase
MTIEPDIIRDHALQPVAEKVQSGNPVNEDDARVLLTTDDIIGLGALANHVREQVNGNNAYYGVNMNLNYTNICELRCPLCAFSCDEGDEKAYMYALEEIGERVTRAVEFGIDEVHIVGGLNSNLKLEYFEEMLRSIREIKPDIVIVAFTAVEYDFFARVNGIPLERVFERLIDAGLSALPGGGAEVFSPRVRKVIAPKKTSGKRWLEVMRTAHSLGLKTNATLLYNHVETVDEVVDHLAQVRALQDETGGFKTFVPLSYHDENTLVPSRRPASTGYDDIRIYATARIFLHNVPHIKGLWMYLGEKMAQVLLRFGVDDIGATYHYEKVVHSAGAKTADYGSEEFLQRLIRDAGRDPKRVTALYKTPGEV